MTCVLPLRAWVPLQGPVAVQAVALPEVQVSVTGCPAVMVLVEADRETTGVAATATLPSPLLSPLLPPQPASTTASAVVPSHSGASRIAPRIQYP